jgi:hypothetical protein
MLENRRIKPGESRLLRVGERPGMEQQAQDTADFLRWANISLKTPNPSAPSEREEDRERAGQSAMDYV